MYVLTLLRLSVKATREKKNPPAQLSADCDNALLCDEASVTFLPKSLELLIII